MTYIIAEIGNNHDGSEDKAHALINAAAYAGADCVKFQIFRADHLVTPDLPSMVGEGTQLERMRSLEFTDETWQSLIAHASQKNVHFAASVFDEGLVEKWASALEFIKIASGDITHISLIRAAARTGRPLVISTGVGTRSEIERAIHGLNKDRLTLLHCVSEYPCPPEHAALGRIAELRQIHSRVGYSDHCEGTLACTAAVALGATVIEKHFTDSERGGVESMAIPRTGEIIHGPPPKGDHIHSATMLEFKGLVSRIRQLETMLGSCYTPPSENRRKMMRGAYAARDMAPGEILGEEDIIALRPATQRIPWDVIGFRAHDGYNMGDPIDGSGSERSTSQGAQGSQ